MNTLTWCLLAPEKFDALWMSSRPECRFVDRNLNLAAHFILAGHGCYWNTAYPVPGELLNSVALDFELSHVMARLANRCILAREEGGVCACCAHQEDA